MFIGLVISPPGGFDLRAIGAANLLGFLVAFVSIVVGTFAGMIAGYYGGWVDDVVNAFVQFVFNIPGLFPRVEAQMWAFVIMGVAFVGVGLAELFQRLRLEVLAGPLPAWRVFLRVTLVRALAGNVAPFVNPPVPFPNRIEILVRLATAMSCLPSLLKSPIATMSGPVITVNSCAGRKVPLPLPKKTLTDAEPALAVMASSLPSPLMSRSTTALPFVPPRL